MDVPARENFAVQRVSFRSTGRVWETGGNRSGAYAAARAFFREKPPAQKMYGRRFLREN